MKQVKKVKCAIPECVSPAIGRSTMCNACGSWWRRIQIYTTEELGRYIYRCRRTGSRLTLLPHRGLKKAS